jgi:hypothetical protein
MPPTAAPAAMREALLEIVRGRSVKRSRHDLRYGGVDLSDTFRELLVQSGFHPVTVHSVAVRPGERVPAFYLHGGIAYFGWVFWEKFTGSRKRKLFGSTIRTARGDWEIQLSAKNPGILYANPDLVIEMDIDRPASV